MTVFLLQQQSRVDGDRARMLAKPKILTIWLLREEVWSLLIFDLQDPISPVLSHAHIISCTPQNAASNRYHVPILQMKTLKLREMKQILYVHTVSRGRTQFQTQGTLLQGQGVQVLSFFFFLSFVLVYLLFFLLSFGLTFSKLQTHTEVEMYPSLQHYP